MAFNFTIRVVGLRGLESSFRRAPKEVVKATRKSFRDSSNRFIREFRNKKLNKAGDPRGHDPRPELFSRTGQFSNALTSKVSGNTIGSVRAVLGWFDPIQERKARVHEYGAIVTGNPYLSIPLYHAMNARGVELRPITSYTDTFLISRGPDYIVMHKIGRNMALPIYYLTHQVEIPPRLEFAKTFESDENVRRMVERLNVNIRAGITRITRNA